MKFKVQVITLLDDGEESLREVACIERDELSAVSLGLSIADSKTMLQGIQEVVVEWQMNAYLDTQRHCPQCGKLRHHKGSHHTVFRTVFGDVSVESPRFTHCPCQAHETESCSPLAELLPERTTPELLYLETKWASLSSYGMTIKLLQDVLPFDEPLEPVTIRNHVFKLAERLEEELGDEQVSFIEGCPRDWGELPTPDGPLTVGIDGGYVKAQGMEQGWFEVIAGKSILSFRRGDEQANPSIKCFAFVQTYDEKPKRRLFELLQAQGLQMNQQIEFLSDGGDTVRDIQLYLSPEAEHLLGPGVAKVNFLAKWAVSFSYNGAMRRNSASFALFSVGERGQGTILFRLSSVLRNALLTGVSLIIYGNCCPKHYSLNLSPFVGDQSGRNT